MLYNLGTRLQVHAEISVESSGVNDRNKLDTDIESLRSCPNIKNKVVGSLLKRTLKQSQSRSLLEEGALWYLEVFQRWSREIHLNLKYCKCDRQRHAGLLSCFDILLHLQPTL